MAPPKKTSEGLASRKPQKAKAFAKSGAKRAKKKTATSPAKKKPAPRKTTAAVKKPAKKSTKKPAKKKTAAVKKTAVLRKPRKNPARKKKEVENKPPLKKRGPPSAFGAGKKKRLKKSVAARASAKADLIEQAEKDRARAKVELEKAREKAKVARKRELKRAKIRARREAERETVRLEKEQLRALREAEQKKLAQKKLRARARAEKERAQKAAEKEAEKKSRDREKARLAAQKQALKQAQAGERQRQAEEKIAARERIAQEKAEAKVALSRAREDAKKRAALEKSESKAARERARQEHAQAVLREKQALALAKEEAQKRREEAKAAALQEKKDLARKAAKEKKARKEIEKSLKENSRAENKRLGASAAELLSALLAVFSARPDVRVTFESVGPPLSAEQLAPFLKDVPPDVLAWYRTLGPVELSWVLKGHRTDSGEGGRVEVPPLHELAWTPRGKYLLPKGTEETGDAEISEWTSIEEYVTAGARSAFTFCSMKAGDAEGERDAGEEKLGPRHRAYALLLEQSASLFTPESELLAGVQAAGLQTKQAEALLAWLGPNARLLLHRSQTEEGKRREVWIKKAEADPAFGSVLEPAIINVLNSGPPVGKSELSACLAAHADFLQRGGGGGTFRLEVENGMPFCRYLLQDRRPWSAFEAAASGQARLSTQNLSGAKLAGKTLSFADLSGVRAPEVSFARADLRGSVFVRSLLSGANFAGADLTGCDFSACDLVKADFRKAVLKDTNFENADLTSANFAGAVTAGTKFGGALVKGIKY